MEPHTIDNKYLAEFMVNTPIQGGYDKVSDFGQESIIQRERDMKEKMGRQTVYFDEERESIIHRN